MITSIDHVVLTVSDIDASCEFLRRALLADVIVFAAGRKAIRFGDQKINLQTFGQELRNNAAIGSGDLCLISSWPMEKIIEHLKTEGIEILEGPVQKSGAKGPITSVYFNDLDRNLIEVSVYA